MLRPLAATNYGLSWVCVSGGRAAAAARIWVWCQISFREKAMIHRTRIDSTAAAAAAVTTNCGDLQGILRLLFVL